MIETTIGYRKVKKIVIQIILLLLVFNTLSISMFAIEVDDAVNVRSFL